MQEVINFFNGACAFIKNLPLWLSYTVVWSVFFVLSIVVLVTCLCNTKVKACDKRPYLHLLNAFTALTLAIAFSKTSVARSFGAGATFWLVGYLFYGLLCALSAKPAKKHESKNAYSQYSSFGTADDASSPYSSVAVAFRGEEKPRVNAKSTVRLEHAVSITDKLLAKNLGRGDRQELEKMKGVLYSMQVKGDLSAEDHRILNGHFNCLLKMMTKYDL